MGSIQDTDEQEQTDTEITLGMRSLLGIFFGLVLICGVFFGFGYSLGRGSSSSPRPASPSTSESAAETNRPKPAAQQDLASSVSQTASTSADSSDGAQPQYTAEPGGPVRRPVTGEAETNTALRKPSASVVKPVTQEATMATAPPKPAPAIASAIAAPPVAKALPAVNLAVYGHGDCLSDSNFATSGPMPAVAAPAVPTMVQIAAVSRQEDADVLVSALKKHGYNVVVRNEPKDVSSMFRWVHSPLAMRPGPCARNCLQTATTLSSSSGVGPHPFR